MQRHARQLLLVKGNIKQFGNNGDEVKMRSNKKLFILLFVVSISVFRLDTNAWCQMVGTSKIELKNQKELRYQIDQMVSNFGLSRIKSQIPVIVNFDGDISDSLKGRFIETLKRVIKSNSYTFYKNKTMIFGQNTTLMSADIVNNLDQKVWSNFIIIISYFLKYGDTEKSGGVTFKSYRANEFTGYLFKNVPQEKVYVRINSHISNSSLAFLIPMRCRLQEVKKNNLRKFRVSDIEIETDEAQILIDEKKLEHHEQDVGPVKVYYTHGDREYVKIYGNLEESARLEEFIDTTAFYIIVCD